MKKFNRTLTITLALSMIISPIALDPAWAVSTNAPWGQPMSLEEERTMRATNIALAKQLDLNVATINDIALQLGLRTPKSQYSFTKLVADVRKFAESAQGWKAKYTAMKAEVDQLTNASEREFAQVLLRQAKLAFDEGRLADAEVAFEKLSFLRNSESETAQQAWDLAVESQAQMAALQGDEARASDILIQSAKTIIRKTNRRAWRKFIVAATYQYESGTRNGDIRTLSSAIDTYSKGALPLVTKTEFPNDWADAQNRIGLARRSLGNITRDPFILNQAIVNFGLALEIFPNDIVVRHNIATVLMSLARIDNNIDKIVESRTILKQLYYTVDPNSAPALYRMITATFAEATGFLGSETRDTALLDRAIRLFESALGNSPDVPPSNEDKSTWAEVQRNLGRSLFSLAVINKNPAMFRRSEIASARSQLVYSYGSSPSLWRSAEYQRAVALVMMGLTEEDGINHLKAAESAFRGLLALTDRARDSVMWSQTNDSLANVRRSIAVFEAEMGSR